jgi:SNF2 family DNA or RNA helicase
MAINLSDLKGVGAIDKLSSYSGKNPYLSELKVKFIDKGKLTLTPNQEAYILENHDKEPFKVDRVVGISSYLGTEFQTKYNLKFVPERIYIGFILAENEKAFHVYGKLTQKQPSYELYWLPKTQVLDDPYFESIDVNVDFQKYIDLDVLGRKPYQHQKEGVQFLLSRKKCILALDMGLGKSVTSIIAALESGAKKILIICPSSTKINWEREIHMLQEYDTSIISGRKWNPAKFTIINYDILKNFHTVVKRGVKPDVVLTDMVDSQFDLMIVDEAHYLKNHDSIRGMIVADLVKKLKMEYVWLLTGTPVANRPKDLYNLLKIIDHPLADNWQFYVKRYCDGKKIMRKLKSGQTKTIWLVDGSSNLDELSVRIKNVFMRRMKNEVIDMPDKIIVPTHQELSASEYIEYEGLWEEYLIKRAEEKKKGTPDRDLVELILLRQFIALKAVPHTIEMAEDIIENGGKVIIFTSFSEELLTLQEHFGRRCVAHHGSMNNKDKQKSVDVFQNNSDIKVFIGNIMSAGVGITLTAADTVIFNSFDWVTGNNEQAEDRAYRIGQKNNVTVYYQLFQDTITTRMWYTLKYKKSVIDKILGVKNKEEEIITEFIECTDE